MQRYVCISITPAILHGSELGIMNRQGVRISNGHGLYPKVRVNRVSGYQAAMSIFPRVYGVQMAWNVPDYALLLFEEKDGLPLLHSDVELFVPPGLSSNCCLVAVLDFAVQCVSSCTLPCCTVPSVMYHPGVPNNQLA